MKIAALLIAAVAAANANAVVVRGGPSCPEWTKSRQTTNEGANANEFWLLGYLSGLAVSSNADVLRNTTNPSLMAWIDNYCRTNTLHYLEQAGSGLFNELKRQKEIR